MSFIVSFSFCFNFLKLIFCFFYVYCHHSNTYFGFLETTSWPPVANYLDDSAKFDHVKYIFKKLRYYQTRRIFFYEFLEIYFIIKK